MSAERFPVRALGRKCQRMAVHSPERAKIKVYGLRLVAMVAFQPCGESVRPTSCDVFYRQMFPSITHKFLYLIYTTMVVLQCLHATLSFQRIQCPLQQWRKQPFLFPIHHYSLFLVYYCIIMVKKEKDFG